MFHFGHANALRQAKMLGGSNAFLVVGVHNDADIEKNKGPPVMHELERYAAVEACKWVDLVVRDAPYVTQLSYLHQYQCDFVVHGDDLVLAADGTDCYAEVKAAGKFRTVPRTVGVSTTDLVGRMLLMSRAASNVAPASIESMAQSSPYTRVSKFVPSTQKIVQFSEGNPERKASDKVVYVDGGFDLMQVGHLEFLREARQMGTYLIVGVHTDEDVRAHKGIRFPVMTLQERVLSVLSCRYVSEVIVGAPYAVTKEMIELLNIGKVVSGTVGCHDPNDAYAVPRALGIWSQLKSPSSVTTEDIVQRILDNYSRYAERNRKKEAKEIASLEPAEKKHKN